MKIEIRPFGRTDKEYELYVKIMNEVWPEHPETVAGLRHYIENVPETEFVERYLLYADDTVAGIGDYRRVKIAERQDVYGIDVCVLPDFRLKGIGRHFYQFGMTQLAKQTPKPAIFSAETREDQAGALAWLEKLGYKVKMRYPISYLDVQKFDPTPFAGLAEKMEREGIEIKTFVTLREEDPEADRKYWELTDKYIVPAMPSLHEHVERPLEEGIRRVFKHPEFRPDANFIAVYNGEYVAASNLWGGSAEKKKLSVGLTGTKTAFRQKGIATALKLHTIAYAKAHGFEQIETDNEENNPMFEINLKLGFEKHPGWVELEKEAVDL